MPRVFEKKEEILNLISNNGAVAEKEEIEDVRRLSEMERAWWRGYPSYKTNEQILEDFKKGALAKIESNKNLNLIMRFLNPNLEKWRPYLNKDTAKLLYEIGARWREKMRAGNLPDDIRLAITSLIRTVDYQKEIIRAGKLAMPDSPHTKGQSFDIDGCGYYIENSIVNPRQCENYQEIYKPLVHKILKEVLEEMKNDEYLSYIQEYKNTDSQCFHITRNPACSFL